jgi:hypothetical protein
MEAPYPPQSQPPPSQPTSSMAPGPPSSMSTNDGRYRHEPPPPAPPPYHAPPPPPQHQQNGPQYGYNPNSLPSLANRTPLPDQLHVSENGGASSTTLPPPGSMEQMVEGTQTPPSHSMIELGRRYAYVNHNPTCSKIISQCLYYSKSYIMFALVFLRSSCRIRGRAHLSP